MLANLHNVWPLLTIRGLSPFSTLSRERALGHYALLLSCTDRERSQNLTHGHEVSPWRDCHSGPGLHQSWGPSPPSAIINHVTRVLGLGTMFVVRLKCHGGKKIFVLGVLL